MHIPTAYLGTLFGLTLSAGGAIAAQSAGTVAIVGGTVIDGNGGAPLEDAVIVVSGSRIAAVGLRARVSVPKGAQVVDAAGRFIVPGLIDTNVHLSLYGGIGERYETLIRYASRQNDIVLEAAQVQLRHGVTTVRDSYGLLVPLTEVRDAIAAGTHPGARVLAAGNIVGWGGPYSVSFSLIQEKGLTLFQEQMNDAITEGAGEELMVMSPEELRKAINAYLDKGPNFLKYGGTSHFSQPTFIGFSPEAQKILVEETHKRGRVAETHATTPEGLRLSLEAGIDLVQHPEVLDNRELPDDLVRFMCEKNVIGSMLANTITGEAWQKHLKSRDEAARKRAEEDEKAGKLPGRARTSAEERQRESELGVGMEMRRKNAQKLVRAACLVTVGTDNYWAAASELTRTPKPEAQDHGIGTVIGIEGLVELGMTPAQAIVAGTKNGALACKSTDFGTIEAGKFADLLILAANPLTDIKNLRSVVTVMKDGRVVDRDRLPEKRVLSRPPAPAASSAGSR